MGYGDEGHDDEDHDMRATTTTPMRTTSRGLCEEAEEAAPQPPKLTLIKQRSAIPNNMEFVGFKRRNTSNPIADHPGARYRIDWLCCLAGLTVWKLRFRLPTDDLE